MNVAVRPRVKKMVSFNILRKMPVPTIRGLAGRSHALEKQGKSNLWITPAGHCMPVLQTVPGGRSNTSVCNAHEYHVAPTTVEHSEQSISVIPPQ